LELYREKAMELFNRGLAYWCVCTPEELEARRKEAQARGKQSPAEMFYALAA
jgi:glutamyl-tRNA synthetase